MLNATVQMYIDAILTSDSQSNVCPLYPVDRVLVRMNSWKIQGERGFQSDFNQRLSKALKLKLK